MKQTVACVTACGLRLGIPHSHKHAQNKHRPFLNSSRDAASTEPSVVLILWLFFSGCCGSGSEDCFFSPAQCMDCEGWNGERQVDRQLYRSQDEVSSPGSASPQMTPEVHCHSTGHTSASSPCQVAPPGPCSASQIPLQLWRRVRTFTWGTSSCPCYT